MVKGDGGDGQGDVHQDNIQAHGNGEGEHRPIPQPSWHEETDERARKDVEGDGGAEEVKGGECYLALFERGITENGFIGEDLEKINVSVSAAGGFCIFGMSHFHAATHSDNNVLQMNPTLTIATVATVFKTIHKVNVTRLV